MKRLLIFMLAFCVVLSMTACGGNTPADEPTVSPTEPPITELPASEGLEFKMYDTYCEVSGIGTCTDKDVVIPNAYNGLPVTYIGDKAFEYCGNLNSITIPDGVTGIGDSAFFSCAFLTSVTIPDSVTVIGNSAFENCGCLTSVVIPDGVISIGNSAFSDCINLTSVTIPDGVTSIGDSAFSGCTKLTSITIPDSVTSIGWGAFYACTSLKYNIYDNAHYLGNSDHPFMVLVTAQATITSCDIHEDTKFIMSYAFIGCSSLTSVTIPDSVTSIGGDAFDFCRSLQYNIYDNAYYLGNSNNPFFALITAVSTSIDSCDIHANTKIISGNAFNRCSSLTSVTIPNGVTCIGGDAFSYCDSLTNIIYDGTTEQWKDVALEIYWNYKTPATEVICSDGPVSLK